jgi:hypothetical protein
MSHWNKQKVTVSVRLHILDICFTKNDYFLKNSRYTIFQKNKAKNRIKSLRNIKDSKDLIRLPIEETMIIRSTLYQEKSQKNLNTIAYHEKSKKIIIRQLSKLKGDAVYRDIGYLEIPLHSIIQQKSGKDYEFPLIDPEKHAEGTVRVNIEWSSLSSSEKGRKIGFFGFCQPSLQEPPAMDPKMHTDFFQRLRLRFTLSKDEMKDGEGEDDDLKEIPLNASVYGNLDQSYSNLLEIPSRKSPSKQPSTKSGSNDEGPIIEDDEMLRPEEKASSASSLVGKKSLMKDDSRVSIKSALKVRELPSVPSNSPSVKSSNTGSNSLKTGNNSQQLDKTAPSSDRGNTPVLRWNTSTNDISNNEIIRRNPNSPIRLAAITSSRSASEDYTDIDEQQIMEEKLRKSRIIARKLNAASVKYHQYHEKDKNNGGNGVGVTERGEFKVLFLDSDDEGSNENSDNEGEGLTDNSNGMVSKKSTYSSRSPTSSSSPAAAFRESLTTSSATSSLRYHRFTNNGNQRDSDNLSSEDISLSGGSGRISTSFQPSSVRYDTVYKTPSQRFTNPIGSDHLNRLIGSNPSERQRSLGGPAGLTIRSKSNHQEADDDRFMLQ